MNTLPTASFASRLNAFAAAAFVTLTLMAGIDNLAATQSAVPQMAQAGSTQPA